jgi:hypothetical protein
MKEKKMKKLYLILIALVLILTLVVPASLVSADSPSKDVSGSFVTVFSGVGTVKNVGNGIWLGRGWAQHFTYAGDIDGSGNLNEDFHWNTNSLEFNANGKNTFSGSVLGKTGTYTSRVLHLGRDDGTTGWCRHQETILSGTGDLANLRGTLSFMIFRQTDGSWTGTYSGKVHFAP